MTEVKTNNEVEQKVYSSPYKIESNSLSDFDLKFLQLENKEVKEYHKTIRNIILNKKRYLSEKEEKIISTIFPDTGLYRADV